MIRPSTRLLPVQDRSPALARTRRRTQARTAEEVVALVRAAGREGREIVVEHGRTGHGGDPVLLGTAALRTCEVHPEGWACVGAGVSWQQLGARARTSVPAQGLVVAALTHPGPVLPLVRAFEVVTGDGALRRVTAGDEPELFWGLGRAGQALGVVTAVELDLHAVAGASWRLGPPVRTPDDPLTLARAHDADTLQRLAALAGHYDPHGVLYDAQLLRAAAAQDVRQPGQQQPGPSYAPRPQPL